MLVSIYTLGLSIRKAWRTDRRSAGCGGKWASALAQSERVDGRGRRSYLVKNFTRTGGSGCPRGFAWLHEEDLRVGGAPAFAVPSPAAGGRRRGRRDHLQRRAGGAGRH